MLIQLRDVSVSFGGRVALHPVSLRFESGSTTALIGPSGCGKSTLLKSILGLHAVQSGSVCIGDDVLTPRNARQLRHRIGYVIQEGGLFPHLTIRKNASLVADHLGRPDADTRTRIDQLASQVQLDATLMERFPHQLSGGQRQRAALLRALVLDPPILLLDEPLGALDPITRVQLQDELKQLFATLRKTVLIVSHDVFESGYLAAQLMIMREGQIVQRGTLKSLQQQPADEFVREFIAAQGLRKQEVMS